MTRHVHPDWPREVHPPDTKDWELTAITWLLDQVPEYRLHPIVCRYPLALASIARHAAHGKTEGARAAYRTARTELAEWAPPHAVDAALKAHRDQGRQLAATERFIALIERALRGETITSRW